MRSSSEIKRQRRITERLEEKKNKTVEERSDLFYKKTLCAVYDFSHVFKFYSKLVKEDENFCEDESQILLTKEEADTLLKEIEKVEDTIGELKEKINSFKR